MAKVGHRADFLDDVHTNIMPPADAYIVFADLALYVRNADECYSQLAGLPA